MTSPPTSSYVMTKPDENDEKDRLDLQHEIWLLALQNRLHTTAFTHPPKTILDIGCGTATWALSMAEVHPEATITATDLHRPPKLTATTLSSSPNLRFSQFDADDLIWPFPEHTTFDFIHGRMITSGIHNWPRFLTHCSSLLTPGTGRLELLDVSHPFRAENAAADGEALSPFIRFGYAMERVWAANGIDYRATEKHALRLKELGFQDIVMEEVRWPLGPWVHTSEREMELGRLNLENFGRFIRTAGVNLLMSGDDNGEEREKRMAEAQRLVDDAVRDLEDDWDTNRYYLSMKIHRARK
ncbi:S-adenosyl-L-methionine-dependent methyltransferase [Aspergillus sclerotioniger CBS 115572]|uniref:S-adenosyl-L-methionine-dependent methyltransferase n=1 Tax=Aspergillus sclerotioniger CBS 115572 TaxID=1450535 RepID=A0A317WQG1_9EURO|nr:S-adenosyl-L-methionine-dependent methyltransferase [Aspergillus sclerotioniger CBS 115572]PWY88669.1 S-adenosyl-L-methionine-dependent methyltransferase [Aspergillus sclerotioniger CBS 115572]